MKKHVLYWMAALVILVAGCKKEESFELGNEPGEGSLQSDISGDCLPKTVNGTYVATTPLVPTTNNITIEVNVTKTGTYIITTDTINGYYFRATGTFTTLGPTTVTLRGNGTPFVDGTDNFVVSYDGTVCDIAVDVLPAGAGGPAVFTLVSGGTPVNCASAVVTGTYVKDVALNTTHYVDVTVNVTQIGTYTIKATGGGMTFEKTGAAFTTTGNQTVRLLASGTPTTTGPSTITFDAPFASCSFTVTVTGQAVYTIDCPNVTVQGTYQVNTPLTTANTITIPVTAVTTPGAYNITATINGMTFTGSGNLTAPGNIVLTGTGIPTAAASPTSVLALPAPLSCNVNITVVPATPGAASFTVNCPGTTVQGIYQIGVPLTAANTITLSVTVTTGGTYSITTTATNGMTFSGSGNVTTSSTTIVLTGTGTPTAAGSPTTNISLPAPFASCSIPVKVVSWTFQIGSTVYSGNQSDITYDNTTLPPITLLDFLGEYLGSADDFETTIGDLTGGINAGETYSSTTVGTFPTTKAGYFYFFGAGMELEAEDPANTPGANITITVVSHNTTTKTVIATFSGVAYDHTSGTTKTITNGSFTAIYP